MVLLPSPAARLAALALAWLVCLPATAAADVVIHDGGVSRDREAVTWVKERTGQAPTRVLDPDEVLRGPGRLLSSGAEVERCEGQPVAIDAAGKLDQITDRVLSFDLEAALESMRVLDTLLPCSDKPVTARELARLAFLRGAARFDMGDQQAAGESMLEASVFDPDYTGELGFPGAHTQLLESMRDGAVGSDRSQLYVWTPSGSGDILVDGVVTQQIRKQGKELAPGLHLVQISRDERLSGMWVRLDQGPVALVFPETGRRLWADGGRSPGGEVGMRMLLDEVFQGKEGAVHLIHYRARTPMAASFPADGAARVAWTESKPPRSTRVGSQDDKGPGRRGRADPKPGPTEPKTDDGQGVDDTSPDQPPETADEVEPGIDDPTEEPEPAEADDGPAEQGDEASGAGPAQEEDEATGADAEQEEPATVGAADPATGGAAADEPGRDTRPPSTDAPKPRRFRLALTFGYQYAHPFSYGMLGLDVSVTIWGPIHAGVFVRPGYGGNKQFPGEPEVVGPVLFMPMGVAVGVRKPGWLSPFVAGAFQFAYNRDGLRANAFLVGAVVQGGLDISPGDSAFVIRVQGEAGILGQVFNARVGAGVGARF